MNTPFAFKAAYDHIALPLVMSGLPKDKLFKPSVVLMFLRDGQVYRTVDHSEASTFFESDGGKAYLGQFIQHMVMKLDAGPESTDFCVGVVFEAYVQYVKIAEGENGLEAATKARAKLPETLAGHPDSREVVSIAIHHRTGTKMGTLPINEDRSVTYLPLFENTENYGRRTPSRKP